jgi:hypothetical protein
MHQEVALRLEPRWQLRLTIYLRIIQLEVRLDERGTTQPALNIAEPLINAGKLSTLVEHVRVDTSLVIGAGNRNDFR